MTSSETDTTSFEEIYHQYVGCIFRVCYCYLKNRHDAEDLTQETFIRYLGSDLKYGTEQQKKSWLITVAANLCRDQLRSWWKKRRNEKEADALPYNPWEEHNEHMNVQSAVMALPYNYRIVIYLYYYENMSFHEIAVVTGQKESTVRNQARRAREKLKRELED